MFSYFYRIPKKNFFKKVDSHVASFETNVLFPPCSGHVTTMNVLRFTPSFKWVQDWEDLSGFPDQKELGYGSRAFHHLLFILSHFLPYSIFLLPPTAPHLPQSLLHHLVLAKSSWCCVMSLWPVLAQHRLNLIQHPYWTSGECHISALYHTLNPQALNSSWVTKDTANLTKTSAQALSWRWMDEWRNMQQSLLISDICV